VLVPADHASIEQSSRPKHIRHIHTRGGCPSVGWRLPRPARGTRFLVLVRPTLSLSGFRVLGSRVFFLERYVPALHCLGHTSIRRSLFTPPPYTDHFLCLLFQNFPLFDALA